MERWKKWIAIFLLLITISILFACNKVTTPQDVISFYEEKWGVQLPLPDKREAIWSTEESSHGDGEWVNAFHYSVNQNLDNSSMESITEVNISRINNYIQYFIESTISLYKDEEKTKKLEQIQVDAQVGDYYYYKSKNNGNDYFIAVYKNDEQILYTFEWHQ